MAEIMASTSNDQHLCMYPSSRCPETSRDIQLPRIQLQCTSFSLLDAQLVGERFKPVIAAFMGPGISHNQKAAAMRENLQSYVFGDYPHACYKMNHDS